MNKHIYINAIATCLLCSCLCSQTIRISKQEATALAQESIAYHHKLIDADVQGLNLSLEKVSTRNGTKHTQHIPLTRQEQAALRTLICNATSVKKIPGTQAPTAQEETLLVSTDARGKRIFAEAVHMVPWSCVSKDGYAHGAHLALHDAYYPLWQQIINRNYPEVTPQEDADAHAQHQQTINALQNNLQHCTGIDIATVGHTCNFIRLGKLNKKQTAGLCRAKPLPFKGRIRGLSPTETTLIFNNAEGQEICRLREESITYGTGAPAPQQCEAEESMYLSRKDYQRMQQIISQQKEYVPTLSVSQ